MGEFISFLYFCAFLAVILQFVLVHRVKIRKRLGRAQQWSPKPIPSYNDKQRGLVEGPVYDRRPLEEKINEYIGLTRRADNERRKRKTKRNIDLKVWDQQFDQYLHTDDPEKKHPPVIDRAPTLTQCETPHRKSEVCRNCEDDAVIKTWDDTVIRYYRRR